MKAFSDVNDLARERPEWLPWLALVRAALDEAALPDWQTTRCHARACVDAAPLVSGSTIAVPDGSARRALAKLAHAAQELSTPAIAAAARAVAAAPDALQALEAAINRDVKSFAAASGADTLDADALGAVAALAATPVLHACAAQAAISEKWSHGYCPVCGSWPAFAEEQGVERVRSLRCADCGCGWPWSCLQCAYCGNADHDRLGTLVLEAEGAGASIDVCNACSGYLKVLTTLRATSPTQVVLRNLATVELDIAAAARGYGRPARIPYPRDVRIGAHGENG